MRGLCALTLFDEPCCESVSGFRIGTAGGDCRAPCDDGCGEVTGLLGTMSGIGGKVGDAYPVVLILGEFQERRPKSWPLARVEIAHAVSSIGNGDQQWEQCGAYSKRADRKDRDSFRNLILLCLADHAEVDDKNTGEQLYPAELLFEWKRNHEGEHGKHLARISNPITDDLLEAWLVDAFESPITRLEHIAEQLERTGSLNIDALEELRQIISVMNDVPAGPDSLTARRLAYAAEVFEGGKISKDTASLAYAAETLPNVLRDLDRKIQRLGGMM
ncbi:hypothetical protein [Nonomuraea sp. NPDC049400]|uniref:hypothetical protein n=1 Tax=Nonomuraea sp. NPDC049400 TaxID=3364352 RepID=UPI0037B2B4B3